MYKLRGIVKDWKESGALQAHVHLYGFWDQESFLTKSGDLGVVLRVKGIDYESLGHASRDHSVKRLSSLSELGFPHSGLSGAFQNQRAGDPSRAVRESFGQSGH